MKIIVLTDSAGKVVGASLVNGDEKAVANIQNLLAPGLADLRCQLVNVDTLVDLGMFVTSEIKEAEDELGAET
jgi:hypothetical protein